MRHPRAALSRAALSRAAFSFVVLGALTLAGCSTPTPATGPHTISIVASTNVWGDVARQIAGSAATVTSIIDSPAQDPHSYQGDAQVQLALSRADVVIENGGGYDDFVGSLLSGVQKRTTTVLNAMTIARVAKDPVLNDVNEHIWYDFSAVRAVGARLATTLSKLDPSNASMFRANQETFDSALVALEAREASIAAVASGSGVAITEPVPLYLLEACGLVDKTPAAFSKAIEDGTDVAPLVLQQTLRLFSEHAVRLLAYNRQTSGPGTDQVIAAAKKAGIPVVPVTETLPAQQDYLDWMSSTLDAVQTALKAK